MFALCVCCKACFSIQEKLHMMASAMATLTFDPPLHRFVLKLVTNALRKHHETKSAPRGLRLKTVRRRACAHRIPRFLCTTSFRRCLYGIHGIHSQALRNMSPKITNNFAGPSAEHSWGLSPLSPHHHVETHSKLCIFGVCMHANRFTVRESALETRFCPKSITYQEALVPLSVAMSACHCFQSAHHEPAKCK